MAPMMMIKKVSVTILGLSPAPWREGVSIVKVLLNIVGLILPRMKGPFPLNNYLQMDLYSLLSPKGYFGPLGTRLKGKFSLFSQAKTFGLLEIVHALIPYKGKMSSYGYCLVVKYSDS